MRVQMLAGKNSTQITLTSAALGDCHHLEDFIWEKMIESGDIPSYSFSTSHNIMCHTSDKSIPLHICSF